jgi:hypothetical protein
VISTAALVTRRVASQTVCVRRQELWRPSKEQYHGRNVWTARRNALAVSVAELVIFGDSFGPVPGSARRDA